MTNPLMERRPSPGYGRPAYGSQEWCNWRNAVMDRREVEWALNESGQPYLRYTDAFTARNSRDMADRAERDRQAWKRGR